MQDANTRIYTLTLSGLDEKYVQALNAITEAKGDRMKLRGVDSALITAWERVMDKLAIIGEVTSLTAHKIVLKSAKKLLTVIGQVQDIFRALGWKTEVTGRL